MMVNLKDHSYPIYIEKGILDIANEKIKEIYQGKKIMIISDDQVYHYYGDHLTKILQQDFQVGHVVVPHGEQSKRFDMLPQLYKACLDFQLTRTDLIIALGGGVIGDMAGFVASTYLRGIKLVQIPTSLLAQVDSSVGGKVAVDLPEGKNLVGAFYHPWMVLIDSLTLKTLAPRFIHDGMGEVIKYGLMNDRAFFETLETGVPSAEELVRRCVNNKRRIVEQDEFEHGERKLLNLGHTFGHAVEKHSGFALSHGAAVAIGMHMICRVSEEIGLAEEPLCARLDALLEKYGLPTAYVIAPEELAAFARGDKKTAGDTITPVLPVRIGTCVLKKMPLAEFEALAAFACRPSY